VVSLMEEGRRRPAGGRVPPHNLEAEESLLGAMMLSSEAIAASVSIVNSDDFYKPAHAHVYEAITTLYSAGEPVDPVTVCDELQRAGLLEGIGGRSAILRIQAATPAATNASHYAHIVEEHALLRRMIAAAGEIAEMGYEAPGNVTDTLDRAESLVFAVADRRLKNSVMDIAQALNESLNHMEAMYGRDVSVIGAHSGYIDLDNLLLGLQPSSLVVVAARPGQGKTSLALGAATNVAMTDRRPVVFFSMEMGYLELTQRILAAEARIDARKLRTGKLEESEWSRVSGAVGRLAETPFFIDDSPHCTIMDMRAKCRRITAQRGELGLVVVDYLQLMSTPQRSENRQVEVSELSRGLKILARELNCPVMALSQLNRSLEYRADKRPMLADLRECLTADTPVRRCDDSTTVTIGELARTGARDVPVWSMDPKTLRIVPAVLSHAWSTGVKPVLRLVTGSGRSIRLTANHPLYTVAGWCRAADLIVGERIATAMVGQACAEPSSGRRTALLTRTAATVTWDTVVALIPDGEEEVFDALVPETHSFLADDIVVHNSGAIEQDADVVMFIYRDEQYNPESDQKGMAEIIVAKHRNGPTGMVKLSFLSHATSFENMART